VSRAGDDRDGAAPKGAHLDFAGEMSYGDYLRLDLLLDAQAPRSTNHDELLFIIQHQASELWMKLIMHELAAARLAIREDRLPPAFKMLARVSRVMEQLVHAWDVLSTLTPSEYSAMRPHLGSSSGFQSYQYREIEFMLGNKNPVMLKPHAHHPARHAEVQAALNEPSLYDEAIRLIARHGFEIEPVQLARDWAAPRPFSTTRSRPPFSPCTASRRRTGRSTSSPRSWSTSRMRSASGGSAT
jgi:tryptophan 2,3-dioxygenase